MPEISRFFGIIIRMYPNDHPPAHFHAVYNEYEALIEIEKLEIYRGRLPVRVLNLVLEWSFLHRSELRQNWQIAQQGKNVNSIDPLI